MRHKECTISTAETVSILPSQKAISCSSVDEKAGVGRKPPNTWRRSPADAAMVPKRPNGRTQRGTNNESGEKWILMEITIGTGLMRAWAIAMQTVVGDGRLHGQIGITGLGGFCCR
ncbi:hypothetical protein HPP92_001212 [Vanilla planifolia]|uniref:Uncharacterized protein n=1 Tax=Vanilla planifolia TaxID=51239 RepID=A0A835RYV9_VANPL|nr:hypothetical protein HPP92_001212 [Vanilla planifolia]